MGDNKPEIKNLKTVIQDRVSNLNKLDSYKVPDYFVPVNMLVGLINSQEWQKNGVEIAWLENRLIYPHYGVWSPTSQEYLNLLDLYMKSFKKTSDIINTIDIGCGIGVLGIVASKYGLSGELVGIDNNADAVECTKMNAKVHGLGTKMKAMQLDITKLYYSDKMFDSQSAPILLAKYQAYRKILHELGIPSKYDLILCNPPWIPASKVFEINPLDNGVYDPDEKFLKSAINFAKLHLTGDKKGRLLLAYSDLAQIIGLQDKERVEDLCHKAGLVIEEVYQTQMQPPKRPFDVLANYKQEAKVQLFEIFKQ